MNVNKGDIWCYANNSLSSLMIFIQIKHKKNYTGNIESSRRGREKKDRKIWNTITKMDRRPGGKANGWVGQSIALKINQACIEYSFDKHRFGNSIFRVKFSGISKLSARQPRRKFRETYMLRYSRLWKTFFQRFFATELLSTMWSPSCA